MRKVITTITLCSIIFSTSLVYGQNKQVDLEKKLTENRLENIYYKNNYLKGDIKSNKDGLLYLSVPYSKGWTIKIDGKETEFTKANSAFIGVPITKGSHVIEMTYVTPYFKLGMTISIISLIICIALLIFKNPKARRKFSFKKQ